MIILIDNYDSFTYNLYQYFGELGEEVKVIRNDKITIEELEAIQPDAIVLSPGPGHPKDAGICISVIKSFYKRIPILGICLGHQAIGAAFGASITEAKTIKHGKQSSITHMGTGLFEGLLIPLEVMRYHSLVVDRNTLPAMFEITATAMDDMEMMGIKHKNYPLYGLQFHPESIGTMEGKAILKNFLNGIRREMLSNETILTKNYERY